MGGLRGTVFSAPALQNHGNQRIFYDHISTSHKSMQPRNCHKTLHTAPEVQEDRGAHRGVQVRLTYSTNIVSSPTLQAPSILCQ